MRALRSARRLHLPGEPVPVVAGDRRWLVAKLRRSADAGLPARRAAARARQQRPGRHARPARRCSPTPTTGNSHFLAATVRSRTGGRDDPLYVHAKVGIVDDRWLTIGSANLNAHSLLNDTEMNVVTDDAELARATRERLWAEHLELDPGARRRRPPAWSTSAGARSRWSSCAAAKRASRRRTA